MKKLLILFLFFGVALNAQSNFYMQDYSCVYQGKQYNMRIGIFDPRSDGSIVIRCENPNKEWNLKSYDFRSYEPLGYLFVEKGNSDKKVIIEYDNYRNIIAIVFLTTEEKAIYKPVTK